MRYTREKALPDHLEETVGRNMNGERDSDEVSDRNENMPSEIGEAGPCYKVSRKLV